MKNTSNSIFIERKLFKLKFRIGDSLKPRFWTGASYLLIKKNKAGRYSHDQ